MHILLTRPLEDCSEMILKFQSLGHQVSHLPLIRIEEVNYEEVNFSEHGGIVFTSANAVKFLNIERLDKNIKCFCVGDLTEKKARSVGFQNTIAAEGNVRNLKELIIQSYENKNSHRQKNLSKRQNLKIKSAFVWVMLQKKKQEVLVSKIQSQLKEMLQI